jgi:Cys-rich protein (TIGR04453 family)
MILFDCKDPIYDQCGDLCNKFNQCLENYFKNNPDLSLNNQWQHQFYANCIDACMIYNQEIFECYKEQLKMNKKDECKIIVDCTMPVFLNQ